MKAIDLKRMWPHDLIIDVGERHQNGAATVLLTKGRLNSSCDALHRQPGAQGGQRTEGTAPPAEKEGKAASTVGLTVVLVLQ